MEISLQVNASDYDSGEPIHEDFHSKTKTFEKHLKRCAFATTYGVVIVGHRGAGKRTLINHWLLSETTDGVQTVVTLREEETSKTIVHWYDQGDSAVVYDVHIVEDKELLASGDTSKAFSSKYKSRLPRSISLFVFVFRHGRFTDEDKTMFESVLASMHRENAMMISYLVITNCDGMTTEAKQETIVEFKNNPNTCEIAKFMKEIICIGLPDLNKVKPEVYDELKKVVTESETEVNNIFGITTTSPALTIDKLFQSPDPTRTQSRFNMCVVL